MNEWGSFKYLTSGSDLRIHYVIIKLFHYVIIKNFQSSFLLIIPNDNIFSSWNNVHYFYND